MQNDRAAAACIFAGRFPDLTEASQKAAESVMKTVRQAIGMPESILPPDPSKPEEGWPGPEYSGQAFF